MTEKRFPLDENTLYADFAVSILSLAPIWNMSSICFWLDKGVPVTEAVQKEFIGLRDEFGHTQFKFPFEK